MALSGQAQEFIDSYADRYEEFQALAETAEKFVEESLQDHNYSLHTVAGRAKSPSSLRFKVLQKGYTDPASQLTDVLGVRVITYFSIEVDRIVERLRPLLTVREHLDRRAKLVESGKFGYRSVHIVGQLSKRSLKEVPDLKGRVFEIQIRSLLDHAWAEIEHEIVYKSGIEFPEGVPRRFSAIAASFELLEDDFLRLRGDIDGVIEAHVKSFKEGDGRGHPFDAGRLLAALEIEQPLGKGWRKAEQAGAPFTTPIRAVVRGLIETGICSYTLMRRTLGSQGFVAIRESYSSLAGCSPDEVSHVALAALLIGHKDPNVLRLHLPEVAASAEMQVVFPES